MLTGDTLIADIDKLRLPEGAVAFWWLGQLGYVVKVGTVVLYLDAFLMPMGNRLVPPLLDASQVTNAHFVFGTHDHADHIDPVYGRTLREALAQP